MSDKPYKAVKIYQGKAQCYVYYHHIDPLTGKWRMVKSRQGLNTEGLKNNKKAQLAEAIILKKAIEDALKRGFSPFAESKPETEYEALKHKPATVSIRSILELKKNTVGHRTYGTYVNALDNLEKWLVKNSIGMVTIGNINKRHMGMYFDSLLKKGISNKTINNTMLYLNVLFNMAVDRELIDKSPLHRYNKLPEESGKNFPFSEQQKQALKREIQSTNPELWVFVKCIYHLFIRPVELLRIKVGDVDLRTRQIIVHSSAGKNKKQLAVSIPDTFIEEIKALNLQQYPADWYLFGFKLKPSNKPYSRNRVTKQHTKALNAVGITDSRYTMYGWKHTGNVDSFLAGVDIHDLMRQNRHHSINQTYTYLRSLGLRPNVGYSSKAPAL